MGSYRTSIIAFRRKLERFEQTEFVASVIGYLNRPLDNGEVFAQRLPHCCFLLIEWRLQGGEGDKKQQCSHQDVQELAYQAFMLQDNVGGFSRDANLFLNLSRLMVSQGWYQENPIVWNYQIIRYLYLLVTSQSSSWFSDQFEKETSIRLDDFLTVSLAVNAKVQHSGGLINYGDWVFLLCPNYSPEYLAKIFTMMGTSFTNLSSLLKDNAESSTQQNSYFRETILIHTPIILSYERAFSVHPSVSSIGNARKISHIFREINNERYRKKFTKSFEDYVDMLFKRISKTTFSENDIKDFYHRNRIQAKAVDGYCRNGDLELFIDAKGVEPKDSLKYTTNVDVAKNSLKDNVIKGLTQACEVKRNFANLITNTSYDRFLIIITNENFPISNGAFLDLAIPGVMESIFEQQGHLFELRNMFFISIDEFEGLVAMVTEYNVNLFHFLQYCSINSGDPSTSKNRFRQFFSDYSKSSHNDTISPIACPELKELASETLGEFERIAKMCSAYWKGTERSPWRVQEYIYSLMRFRTAIENSFN